MSLLGFVKSPAEVGKSTAELDLQERSTKKVNDCNEVNGVRLEDTGSGPNISFRDIITGQGRKETLDDVVLEEEGDGIMEDTAGDIIIEEEWIGGYECPRFSFSAEEEERMQRPWRRGVIVKLLGRRIGYKALENRLNQMWVRKGVISIIDLSNDYFLVAFSHEDDKKAAMANGPWFIYDHYLAVKDWKPNFQPDSDTIDEVAVWVRVVGLPIEYYSPKALTGFGNRIGRTIKIDKTTTKQERGKYARICVVVNLSKPLLGMFKIGGSCYKIEYEGLHLLCLACGKYGHYKEGCPLKNTGKEKEVVVSAGNGRIENRQLGDGSDLIGGNLDVNGPWKVVQKQRREKKVVEGRRSATTVKTNPKGAIGGSRFLALESNEEDIMCNNEEINVDNINNRENMENPISNFHIRSGQNQMKKVGINGTAGGHVVEEIGVFNGLVISNMNDTRKWLELIGEHNNEVGQEKAAPIIGSGGRRQQQVIEKKKPTNLTTRGGIHYKDKSGGISTSGVGSLLDKFHIDHNMHSTSFETFNLINKSGGDSQLAIKRGKEITNIEEPPDISAKPKNTNSFMFGIKSHNMEILEEDKGTSGGNKVEEEEVEEIVCETL
ncbi:uncharacterized protein LOC131597062 [Vicia villosa]|uniref:uncharacterized protein LOC131597062 n=1 Tax=Vicia villosa TaxID=3911 RepID=UPI00273CB74D|nr:uncharacterized protein LOC131597062 [Vicia villosa]